jgi:hypothetical protein
MNMVLSTDSTLLLAGGAPMMNKHVTHLIGNGLRDAFNAARSSQVGSGLESEIRFERRIYNKERNLVVVEIG